MGSRGTDGSEEDAKKKDKYHSCHTQKKKPLKLNKTVLFHRNTPSKQRLKAQGIMLQYKFVFKERKLTGGIGANVDDLALGSTNLVLVRCRQLSFDHDGVLGPGLQRSDQVTGVFCKPAVRGARWWIDVGNCPAV